MKIIKDFKSFRLNEAYGVHHPDSIIKSIYDDIEKNFDKKKLVIKDNTIGYHLNNGDFLEVHCTNYTKYTVKLNSNVIDCDQNIAKKLYALLDQGDYYGFILKQTDVDNPDSIIKSIYDDIEKNFDKNKLVTKEDTIGYHLNNGDFIEVHSTNKEHGYTKGKYTVRLNSDVIDCEPNIARKLHALLNQGDYYGFILK
jgi:hypothetical protein